jgi:hypothetical protein
VIANPRPLKRFDVIGQVRDLGGTVALREFAEGHHKRNTPQYRALRISLCGKPNDVLFFCGSDPGTMHAIDRSRTDTVALEHDNLPTLVEDHPATASTCCCRQPA